MPRCLCAFSAAPLQPAAWYIPIKQQEELDTTNDRPNASSSVLCTVSRFIFIFDIHAVAVPRRNSLSQTTGHPTHVASTFFVDLLDPTQMAFG
jgi:hypothetical protein